MSIYTSLQLKDDLIANIEGDSQWAAETVTALDAAEFLFNDSSDFSRRQWNTYTRTLNINCRPSDKLLLQKYKSNLYELCDALHGVKDNYVLMSIEILAKSSLEDVVITRNEIRITQSVVIDRQKDYQGQGGFAVVYKKQDPQTGIMFAYKVLDPSPFQGSDPETIRKRFIREAKKLLNYSHDNIVRAYDFGFLDKNSAYIKMEYIEGKNIFDYVKDNPLTTQQRTTLADEYVAAMSYIHSKADVHRDIHYSNVMVTVDGQVKVLDFGFARNPNDTDYDTMFADINRKFTPPDRKYTIQTDVYCVGAVLYVIFTSSDFHISTIREKLNQIENTQYRQAIEKCLQTNPGDWFSDCVELYSFISEARVLVSKSNAIRMGQDSYSLDDFKGVILVLSKIEFSYGNMPTLSTIKNWLDIGFSECINDHAFLTTVELTALLFKLNGVSKIYKQREMSYTIAKEPLERLNSFYNGLNEDDKINFARSMRTIIMLRAQEDLELPF